MEDKQVYTTARSEEIKRQLKAFSKKLSEKLKKFQEKSNETQKVKKTESIKESPTLIVKSKEKKAQNISVSPAAQRNEDEEDAFYKKYVERKSKTDLNDRLSIYSIFIYTIFLVIIIIIAFSIYITLPHR